MLERLSDCIGSTALDHFSAAISESLDDAVQLEIALPPAPVVVASTYSNPIAPRAAAT
jgi:hypothetical protein